MADLVATLILVCISDEIVSEIIDLKSPQNIEVGRRLLVVTVNKALYIYSFDIDNSGQ